MSIPPVAVIVRVVLVAHPAGFSQWQSPPPFTMENSERREEERFPLRSQGKQST
jgi:hypothetical protein